MASQSQDTEKTVLQASRVPDFRDFDAVWLYMENGLNRIMYEPAYGTDIPSLVGLYTAVHNYCTSQRTAAGSGIGQGGAHILGEKLYNSCREYLHLHLDALKQHFRSLPNETLLDRYLDECAHYNNAAQIIHYVFRYLHRHWLKRELDEGKKSVYDIYTLHLILWHGELFKEISHSLVNAMSKLVGQHRAGRLGEVGSSTPLIHLIVSLELDKECSPQDSRDIYGALLEAPLRTAIEASGYTPSPAFFYKQPSDSTIHVNGLARTELHEQLDALILRSRLKRTASSNSQDAGIIKLAIQDLTVIEVEQKVAEHSYLIKHLCAYFGKRIIATNLIPIPNLTEPVLRKVLEWCEHHERCFERPGADEWELQYFGALEQEMLFDILVAANYLDIEELVTASCKTVANMIKGKSPEEIRKTFNITNDFTPEEEEQIRRENEPMDRELEWTDV